MNTPIASALSIRHARALFSLALMAALGGCAGTTVYRPRVPPPASISPSQTLETTTQLGNRAIVCHANRCDWTSHGAESTPREMTVTLQHRIADQKSRYACAWAAMTNLQVIDFSDLKHPKAFYVKLKPACDLWLGWASLEEARQFVEGAAWLHREAKAQHQVFE